MKSISLYVLILMAAVGTFQASAQGKDIPQHQLTKKFGATADDYFKEKYQKAYQQNLQASSKLPLQQMMNYDVKQLSCYLHIPRNYRRNAKGWGLYLHISSGNSGNMPREWTRVFAKHKIIYAGVNLVGNNVPPVLRMAATMDTYATLTSQFKIDPERIYVGGLSGGGIMAVQVASNFPEIFSGTVCHVRNVMWEPEPLSKEYLKQVAPNKKFDKRMVWPSELPYINADHLKLLQQQPERYVFITGDKDYNHEPILKSLNQWYKREIPTLVLDVPGMGHTNAGVKALDAAFTWISTDELSKDALKFKPRHQMYKIAEPELPDSLKPLLDAEANKAFMKDKKKRK